jgi:hypothetical protein
MPDSAPPERLREAENVLKRLGYSRIPPVVRDPALSAEFWVQESGVPRRTFPVFLAPAGDSPDVANVSAWLSASGSARQAARRAIVVVASDGAAEETWNRVRASRAPTPDPELSILVVPGRRSGGLEPHWHSVVLSPKEVLRLATGVVVGLFRRGESSDGSGRIDFEEMLEILRSRFRVDLFRSLNVESDEDALFMLYQLAQRDSYAPGDPAANLHMLVLKPTGPAARLPWFAA